MTKKYVHHVFSKKIFKKWHFRPGRWAEVAASLQLGGPAGGSRQHQRAGGREEAENLKPFFH